MKAEEMLKHPDMAATVALAGSIATLANDAHVSELQALVAFATVMVTTLHRHATITSPIKLDLVKALEVFISHGMVALVLPADAPGKVD